MADESNKLALRELGISTFSRLKDLVRELEDSEKRITQDWNPAEVEFKLNPGEMAWFVAYRTSAASLPLQVEPVAGKARGK
ncbi:hypothetical protein [Sphingomonas sp.]|uniref:hypothetical protein n=1 Tax=Sphingomonas sp. TaxID=28214 RepID=UPI0025F24190|nr:hypothetical protein [Sphingomonas sp.]